MAKKRGSIEADIRQVAMLGNAYDHWCKENGKEKNPHNAHLFALYAQQNLPVAGLSERDIILKVEGKLPDHW